MQLNEQQIQRYSRHILLPEVGGKGQAQLLSSSVLLVGAGGLGSPAGLYLAAAGIGTLGIIDADNVQVSNLQRQVLHTTGELNTPKTESAEKKLKALNPDVNIHLYNERLRAENAAGILDGYDFVIDGTDNFPAKFLVADACYFSGIAYNHAGILRFEGQTMTVLPGQTACYRCVFRSPPPADAAPSCSQAGLLGAVPGVIGSIQATEAIKYLLTQGQLLTNTLLKYDALNMTFRRVGLNRDHNCPLCGDEADITELHDEEEQPVSNVQRETSKKGREQGKCTEER